MAVTINTRQFLERFFGNGNHLKLSAIESADGSARMLQPWIVRLEQGLPSVLPYKHDQGTDWYGVAQSERQLRGLREDLTAFVGPTWSTFRGQRAQLNLGHPVEASIQAFTGGLAFKFQGASDSSGKSREVWKALERMRQVLDRRVAQTYETPRATGRVLGDFYIALQACDRPAAEYQLHYLKTHNRLDPLNLLFLKVQMLAGLQAWNELLRLPELPDLLQVRRPFAVTQALIQAVYQCELSRFEAMNATRSAVAYFQEAILPQYGVLFANRAGSRVAEVVKSFMLLAVVSETPNPTLRDELLAVSGLSEADQFYLQSLARLLPTTTPAIPSLAPLAEAVQASESGNYDRILALLQEHPSSQQSVRLLT